MRDPTIIAFMQNPWFEPGTPRDHVHKYRTDQEFHQKILAETMSGRRLRDAFGPTMFKSMWWDNVAPEAAEEASGVTPVDQDHVNEVITKVKPDLVVTFGNIATEAVRKTLSGENLPVLECHHPNARHRTAADLCEFAIRVSEWCDTWKINKTKEEYAGANAPIEIVEQDPIKAYLARKRTFPKRTRD